MRLSSVTWGDRFVRRGTSVGCRIWTAFSYRRLLCEPLEERALLSVGPELVTLPGMHLADRSVDCFDGQIVYLDFGGARDVTYNGPVVIEGVDVPSFRLPGALAGREEVVIDRLVETIEATFGDSGITFTRQPPAGGEYSTVYIGGDGSAFGEYGSFLGLAEQTDVGNRDLGDSAFVFSDLVLAGGSSVTLPEVMAHEIGHLLGYAHNCHDTGSGEELASVAYETVTHQWITRQAHSLYLALFGVSDVGLELSDYVERDFVWPCDEVDAGESIVEGAVEEDCDGRYVNHFCEGADEDELFDGLFSWPVEADSAWEVFNGGDEPRYPSALDEYDAGDKPSAYWWLGRAMHLLQDMCLPAHVHNDQHLAGDSYESNAQVLKDYFTFDRVANGTSWDFQDWAHGYWSPYTGLDMVASSSHGLWDRIDYYVADRNPRGRLFRETADYTDDYDSDTYEGDRWNDTRDDGFPLDRLAELERMRHRTWRDAVRRPVGSEEISKLARDLGTWAVEQSTMLMRLFYHNDDVKEVVSSPTDLKITGTSSDSITLGWVDDDPQKVAGWVVYRSTGNDTSFSRVARVARPEPLPDNWTPSYTDTGLDLETDQYYRVYAYNKVAGLGRGYASVEASSVKVVTTLSDEVNGSGHLSLREALGLAASDPGKEEIRFDPHLAGGTITLDDALGQLEITSDVDLMGLGVTIDATLANSRVLYVDPAVTDAIIRDLTITGGTTTEDNGGGILNSGKLHVVNSTISHSFADYHGGGIYNDTMGNLVVENSTLSGNSADGDGGGICNAGELSVVNSTITENTADFNNNDFGSGGGVATRGAVSPTLHNTIAAGNHHRTDAQRAADDLWGAVERESYNNLVGDAGDSGLTDGDRGNIVGQDPLLAPLGDYGGPTQTHALLAGSPAIDAGNDARALDRDGHPLQTDQRGEGFARVFGGAVDIGAFEVQLIVSTLDDEDDEHWQWRDLSLREALGLAANYPGKGEVRFAPHLAGGTITLEHDADGDGKPDQLQITSNVDLMGAGVTLDAAGQSRVLYVDPAVTDATIRELTITGGTTTEDNGGGILNSGKLHVVNSTVSHSFADYHGGGIYNDTMGNLVVENSTLSGNSADGDGGGICNAGELAVVNSTITENIADFNNNDFGSGGGVATRGAVSPTLHNTIVAGNHHRTDAQRAADDLWGAVERESYNNLVGDAGDSGLTDGDRGNIVGQDPLLAPLGDYGGPMQTHALLAGSPAIDTGNDARALDRDGNPLQTDQRGDGYARVFDVHVDIGALERQPIVVSTLADEQDASLRWGDLSLREALAVAEAIGGKDVIQFTPELAGGTITLALGHLEITSDVDLMGLGVTIDAVYQSGMFFVHPGVNATIHDLTITRGEGNASMPIGGIFNVGTLSVYNAKILSNSTPFSHGGGIVNRGSLLVANSTISGNSANGDGGGIYNEGHLEVDNSTISFNRAPRSGGGIYNVPGATLSLVNSEIFGNRARNQTGGGISNEGQLEVDNSTISGNQALFGGGIMNLPDATLLVVSSTIAGNAGEVAGGIYNDTMGNLLVENSTISGNRGATNCGGVVNGGHFEVANSTISGNSTDGGGGGILNSGTLAAVNSTIVENTADADNDAEGGGGGLWAPEGSLTLHNTIVAANVKGTADEPPADDLLVETGVLQDGSWYNLVGDAGSSGELDSAKNILGQDPLLAPLGDYGGPTQTHALLPGSPAIDVGGDAWAVDPDGNPLETDQRGEGFDRIVGGAVDIGAFESAAVRARHVFYNNSAFDGNNPAANQQDDDAVAPDKQALLPGGTATSANYTSFARGINGLMIDVANLPEGVTPTADDFELKVGNTATPADWAIAPAPESVTLWPGVGVDGSDRITLIWPDNAIQKQWLQVTVLATENTGLTAPDTFYFGNAIGESGNSTTDGKVDAADMLAARDNPRGFLDPAPIDFFVDFDRDQRVNATDMLIARNNPTHFLNALRLISVPGPEAAKVYPVDSEVTVAYLAGKPRAYAFQLDRLPKAGRPKWKRLLPGHTAGLANYTSYSRGINGIMVDMAGLPEGPGPQPGDFRFRVGNDDTPQDWDVAPQPANLAVRRGQGVGGSDRVTVIWDDNAIQKQWLRVTLLPTPNTGLLDTEVFYFGNAIGESGYSTSDAKVDANDMLAARDNPRGFLDPAPIDFFADFDRDGRVNATDMLIARNNPTHFLNALRLITVPGPKAAMVDAGKAEREPAHDVVLRRAAKQEISPIELGWLHEFEQTASRDRPSSSSKEPLEALLASM